MEVFASIRQKVDVDPKDVIETLIEQEIGRRGWIFENEGKFYRGFEVSAGCHSIDEQEEITKELYDYVKSLKDVLAYLNKTL